VGAALFLLPLLGLLARAGWSSLADDLSSSTARDALRLSFECSLWSTALSILRGVPIAWVLARSQLAARSLLRALVPLPMAPSPAAGTALAWARGRGEFGATITFAGNIAGVTQTTPLAVYLQLEAHPTTAIALSLVLLAVSLVVLVALRDRWFGASR